MSSAKVIGNLYAVMGGAVCTCCLWCECRWLGIKEKHHFLVRHKFSGLFNKWKPSWFESCWTCCTVCQKFFTSRFQKVNCINGNEVRVHQGLNLWEGERLDWCTLMYTCILSIYLVYITLIVAWMNQSVLQDRHRTNKHTQKHTHAFSSGHPWK